ncbi:mitotic checkpoint family protein isoform X1 [Wolffia australiana]
MIIRTPPRQRKRPASPSIGFESPGSDRRLVIYEDPPPSASQNPHEQMVCSYECRQMVKTEVMEALTLAEKQALDYRSRAEALEKSLSRMEQERNQYKDQLRFNEQELAAAKGRENALQEQLLKEVTDSQERYRVQVQRCSELEVKLKRESELRRSADSAAQAAKDKVLDLEVKVKALQESLERQEKRNQKENLYFQDEADMSSLRLNAELEIVKNQAENNRKESELLKEQMTDLRERLNQCLAEKKDLEHKISAISMASPDSHVPAETQFLIKHLQEELRNNEIEVLEARKQRSIHVNTVLLKEKLLEEKSRRENAEADLVMLQEVQFHAEKLENELKMWKSLTDEIPDVSSFNDICEKFSSLQRETITGMLKVGEVTAQVKELEVALDSAIHSKIQLEQECNIAKGKAEESNLEVKRLQSMVDAIVEERDRLRKSVSPCKNEVEGVDGESGENPMLKELEKSLAAKEELIKALEDNIRDQGIIIHRQQNEIRALGEQLCIEERKTKSLEREGDRLRAELALLESKLGHGDYSTETTKVLRMVNTLGVDGESKQTIEALRAELLKTKEKLQAVEELKGQSDAGNLIDARVSEKLTQLKSQIATLEKREERYRTVFADKISVFRRACCSLFGYKVVMDDHQRPDGIPVTRFTLLSIYAQSDDEKLEFEYESGNPSILVNDYSSQPEISRQVDIFIKRMSSIPAFTANLTMESFNRRTLS